MANGTATVENSTEGPEKLKIELPNDPEIPLLSIYQRELKSEFQKEVLALLCLLQYYSQYLRCENNLNAHWHPKWMDKGNVVYTSNGVLFSLKKEGNSAICDNMDEP